MNKPTKEQLQEFLSRGVSEVIERDKLTEKLEKGEQIRVYLGIDPTGTEIHIGHAIALRKLRKLQDWGHKVILLIGDFTAMIGDPTGKDELRNALTAEQVLDNAKDYQQQSAKILKFGGENPVTVKYNSEWLGKMNFSDVVELASNFTVQQMLERDMFDKRMKDGKPIHMHEFFYPLMQGYDSVALDVDLELGGSDQLFNMLAGRTLKEKLRGDEKHVMTMSLLEGSDGRKMSKSYNNHIPLNTDPTDMFGRVMSIKDELILQYFELATDVSEGDMKEIKQAMEKGENPRDYKMQLGREIVTMYHSADDADKAEQAFIAQFQKGAKPTEIEEVQISSKTMMLVDLLVESGLCSSKSDARRMVKQNAVRLQDKLQSDPNTKVSIQDGDILQKGKRGFRKLKTD
jgi:tyrosyl-tRNA synthetase